uniref:Reverse transcriptase domain-containing protein n=1 Tax=Tanacetum cinerariifolium TaxID=118510 RepID=A0A6L2N0M3_TANCI|nr:hypothetical protein [Tanacetum cinerariifolium]
MSSASSAITYTSVCTNFEPWRFYEGSDEEPSDVGSPGVIVYGYDGLPIHPVALPSSDYAPGPEHPPSPNYVPGPKHPPSPVYVPNLEYPEYLIPSGDEASLEEQPLPDDASPISLSSSYMADSNPEEDPEEDHADYPADGGDGDDESSNDEDDDDDADDKDGEASEDEDDEEEEEEHLASTDSSTIPIVDPIPSTGDTEAFETDEPQTPILFPSKAEVVRLLASPTPPPSPLTPLSSPLPHIPSPPLHVSSPPLPLPPPIVDSLTYAEAPLGYRAVRIRMKATLPPLLIPSTFYKTDIPEAEMPPQKRACFTTLASGFEVGESSAAGAARQPSLDVAIMDATAICHMSKEDRSAAIEANIRKLEAHVAILMAQTSSLQTQLTTALGRIQTLEARDPKPQDEPAKAGSGRRRHVFTVRECTYTDFLKCQPLNFKGTEGVVGLTQWMFPEESDEVEKYVGGLPDMIHGSVKASKPKTMQEAIEFATELMDKKIRTLAERQAKKNRKFDDTLRNNQNQQQPFKRNNVARAYTAGPGEKKPYRGSKPLCLKYNYHHDGQCALKSTNCKRIGHSAWDYKSPVAATNN